MSSKVDVKVVLLGKEYSGKTCLVERYLHGRFNANVPYQNLDISSDGEFLHGWTYRNGHIYLVEGTIGAAFGAKKEFIDEKALTLGIWDTAGSERYEAMSRIYYRGARAAIVCYDLTDDSSFKKVKFWVKELKTHEENCKIFLCGTKLDLVQKDKALRRVDYHTTTDFADEINSKVYETSSLTGQNVDGLFYDVAKSCLEEPIEKPRTATLTLEEPAPKKSCWCRL